MAARIPDLWRLKEDAARLYQLYLARLQSNLSHERVVSACRQIRRYAARGPGLKRGLFTYPFEINALCELKNFKAAWRQLRKREVILFGNRLDLARRQWSRDEDLILVFDYAPLLYFLGRYRQGCRLLEIALGFWLGDRRKVRSFNILLHIYNGVNQPCDRFQVTLSHFYDRLSTDLRHWQHWETFINRFHPRLFRLTGVHRQELLADSALLAVFSDRLDQVTHERAVVPQEERDLIESPSIVRSRQEAERKQLDKFKERIKPVAERTEGKLQELFPELQGL
jgi:hypothetical protein